MAIEQLEKATRKLSAASASLSGLEESSAEVKLLGEEVGDILTRVKAERDALALKAETGAG